MKKYILLLAVSCFLVSCNGLFDNTRKIVIKGKISKSSNVQAMKVRSESTLTLADAKKALIFYGNEYNLVDIDANGSFSGKAPVGSATVVAFLTADNQFIGNLFAGGMNVLPLVGLPDDLTSIDLSTLTLDGNRVIPANDPVGTEIQLSAEELNFMQQVSTYYESLAKNIDMDKDGKPDVLGGNQILVNSLVYVTVGKYGRNSTAPFLLDTAQFKVNYSMRIEGDKSLYDKEFSPILEGPAGAPYSNIKSETRTGPDCFISMFNTTGFDMMQHLIGTYLPFENGVYTFTLSEKNKYTFTHINVDMGNYMVIVVPTFHADNAGYISKVTYEFQLPDGTKINPRNLLSSYIRIQLNSAQYNQLYEGLHLYGAYDLENYDFYNEKIEAKVKLSDVSTVGLAYIDLLGNEYQMNWTAQ
ncbi:MAG: hypothetical protein QM800_01615 [Paludibacter sp.]